MGNVADFFPGRSPSTIEFFEQLKVERRLSDQDIKDLGISVISGKDAEAYLGHPESNPLIRLPYYGITGEKLSDNRGEQLARYRRVVANSKGERYTQRAGTGARHYLPRLPIIDWINVSRDPSIDLFYTEGEFKAISGCKSLGPCVGNAGITSWRGKDGTSLAAPLDSFLWRGRTVYLAYDAESSATARVPLKSNIERALGEISLDLKTRGASVKMLLIARTPFFKEGVKMGLDDYFNAGGTVEALMATAEDATVDEDLADYWRKYAVCRDTGAHIRNILTGSVHSKKEILDYIETKKIEVGKKLVHKFETFLNHDEVNWFSKYVFDPQQPIGYIADDHLFNTWQGFAVEPERSEHYDQHIADFNRFVEGVWGQWAGYFLDWSAHIFQRPWELTTISPILVSKVKGVGKSLTGSVIRALIGTKSSFIGSIDGLTERHTGELEGKLFVQVDEADALFARKENALKALDGDEIRIRKMNTDGYTVKNILRKFYTTNENAAFRLAADERRYLVVRVNKTHVDGLPGAEWNTWLRGTIVPMLKSKEALSDIMHYLMERDISAWDPTAHVPRTDEMIAMSEAGQTKKETAAQEIYSLMLNTEKIWVTDANLTGKDSKMWGDIRSMLMDDGGRVVALKAKVAGKTRSFRVWMPSNLLLNIVEDADDGARIAPNQLTGEQAMTLLMATKAATDPIVDRTVGSKM